MPQDKYITPELWGDVGTLKAHDRKVIDAAKDKARGDLDQSDWVKQGYFLDESCTTDKKPVGEIAREHVSSLSVPAFVKRYEEPNLPVVIDGIADEWPAMNGAWEPRALFATYRHRRFRCGEDDDGYPVKMKLKYFLRYMAGCRDDSPMYIFDSMYNDNRTSCGIMNDYRVPHYFGEDIFRMVGEHRRPPYRWMLIGPKRSGTTVHIDPLGTSAWNTLIYGRKRWVLFKPELTRAVVKGRDLVDKSKGEDDEAIDYFTRILPRIKERESRSSPSWVADNVIEFTQYPGETVFVPGGWWHAVYNLDDTIAVTQNFCSSTNFERVWLQARQGRRGMARKLLRQLRIERPDLAAVADRLNARDGWNELELAQKHKTRKAAKAERRARRRAARLAKQAMKKAAGYDSSDSDSSSSSSSSSGSSSSGSVTSESSKSSSDSRKKQATSMQAAPSAAAVSGSKRPAASPTASSSSACSGSARQTLPSGDDSSVDADNEMSDSDGRLGSNVSAAVLPSAAATDRMPKAGIAPWPVVSAPLRPSVKKQVVNSDDSSSTDGQNSSRRKKRK